MESGEARKRDGRAFVFVVFVVILVLLEVEDKDGFEEKASERGEDAWEAWFACRKGEEGSAAAKERRPGACDSKMERPTRGEGSARSDRSPWRDRSPWSERSLSERSLSSSWEREREEEGRLRRESGVAGSREDLAMGLSGTPPSGLQGAEGGAFILEEEEVVVVEMGRDCGCGCGCDCFDGLNDDC